MNWRSGSEGNVLCDKFRFGETMKITRYPDSTGQRHIPDVEGRVVSVDNGIFIHAIVPRHVETGVLLSGKGGRGAENGMKSGRFRDQAVRGSWISFH